MLCAVAGMAKLADARDLGSRGATLGGSTPPSRTNSARHCTQGTESALEMLNVPPVGAEQKFASGSR